jgi:hypothetical protein
VVQPEIIDSIEFDQPEYALVVGSVTTARVVARRAGVVVSLVGPQTITFATSEASVATVSSLAGQVGTLRGVSAGETRVTATLEGMVASAPVRVLAATASAR